MAVTVEFFGVPRHRAGRAELLMPRAATVAALLEGVRKECPQLHDLVKADGRLAAHYLLSLNGKEFLTDPDRVLPAECRILLLSADAGG